VFLFLVAGWAQGVGRHTVTAVALAAGTVTAWLRREVPQAQALPGQPERPPPDEPELEAAAPPAPWAT
jgi:hypothetical protein